MQQRKRPVVASFFHCHNFVNDTRKATRRVGKGGKAEVEEGVATRPRPNSELLRPEFLARM
jgi:hypothetical protein